MSRRNRLVLFLIGAAGLRRCTCSPRSTPRRSAPPPTRCAMRLCGQRSRTRPPTSSPRELRRTTTHGRWTPSVRRPSCSDRWSVLPPCCAPRPASGSRAMRRRRDTSSSRRSWRATSCWPSTLLLGADVVLHGQLTPGGGFQGGAVLGTGVHLVYLVYLAGRCRALERVRPLRVFVAGEAVGTAVFAATGLAALAGGGSWPTCCRRAPSARCCRVARCRCSTRPWASRWRRA